MVLINGVMVRGQVVGLSSNGVEVRSGDAVRVYPWVALAPGTRFRYDTHYRANLAGYLSGAEPAALTQAPDPRYDPLRGELPAEDETPVGDSGYFLDVLARGERIVPAEIAPFRAPPFRPYSYCAFRYGNEDAEIASFLFSPEEPARMAVLPRRDGRFSLLRATAAENASDPLTATVEPLRAQLNDVSARYEIRWHAPKQPGHTPQMTADVTLSMSGQETRFALLGAPALASGTNALLVRPLLMRPTLQAAVVRAPNGLRLHGWLHMGRFDLRPRSGTDNQLNITLRDDKDKVALRHKGAVNPKAAAGEPCFDLPLRDLPSGVRYRLLASVNLGPLLGEIAHAEEIVIPRLTDP